MTDTRKNRLLRTMLFSGLGIFACLLLGNYGGKNQMYKRRAATER